MVLFKAKKDGSDPYIKYQNAIKNMVPKLQKTMFMGKTKFIIDWALSDKAEQIYGHI